jgi:hypothetical protein
MKKYGVEIPIAGYVYIEVEAENKEEAIEIALETEWSNDDIEELDTYNKLVEGNVCYTYHTRATAREIKD